MSERQVIDINPEMIAKIVEEDISMIEQQLDIIEKLYDQETREYFEKKIEESKAYAADLRADIDE